jgi:hydroxymethylpyrimidine/phosphomethylpyrimidine kinase
VLVKGSHLAGPHAVDLLAVGRQEAGARVIELASPRLRLPPFHGGGCALAALVAGRLARHADDYAADPPRALADAVRWAKSVHHEALMRLGDVGGDMKVLFA